MSTGINIEIGANGTKAKTELRAVSKEIKGVGGAAKMAGAGAAAMGLSIGSLAAAATASAAAFAKLGRELTRIVGETAAVGDETAKTARNLAVSADGLQTLTFAAGRAGTDLNTLKVGLRTLQKNMLESQMGNKRVADTFDMLGVAVTRADGSLRSGEEVFSDVANAMQRMGGTAEAVAMSQLLLGRGASELGSLFAGGAAGIAEMGSRLDVLGGRMSSDLLDASERYEDSLLDLKVAVSGVKYAIADELLPTTTDMIDRFTLATVGARDLAAELNGISKEGRIADIWAVVKAGLSGTSSTFGTVAAAVDLVDKSLLALEQRGQRVADSAAAAAAEQASINTFYGPLPEKGGAKPKGKGAGKRGPDPAAEAERAAEAEQRRADTVAAQIRAMERRMELSTADAEAQIRLSATFEEQDIARRVAAGEVNAVEAEHLRILNEQRTMLDLLDLRRAESAEAARVEADAAKKLHDEEAQRIRDLMALDEQRAQHRKQVAQSSVEAVTGILALGADIAGDIYDSEAKKNKAAAKEAFEARRIFLISQTIIGGLAGSINAIASAPNYIVGAIQAGLVAAQTVAAVAGIAAEKPSFADAGMLPTSLRDTHQSVIKRNDEMIVDPRGTRDVSAMFAMMRRQMEIGQQDQGGQITTHVVLDGEVVATSVERRFVDRAERGNDYRKRIRV